MSDIEMNIPNAAEARRSIEKGEYEKAVTQARQVEAKIATAIAQGQKSTGGDGHLESSVQMKLKEMGYKCECGSQYNESYWSVSWA